MRDGAAKHGHHYADIIHRRSVVVVDGGVARWLQPRVKKNMPALKSGQELDQRLYEYFYADMIILLYKKATDAKKKKPIHNQNNT